MNYIILFLEGIITFISPCILPMVPIYISYFMGSNTDNGNNKNKGFINSLAFVIGFAFIFTLLGGMAGKFGNLINEYINIFNIISGILLIIFGLNYIGILKVNILQRTFRINNVLKSNSIISSLLFGFVFGVGWTPCVGPFLGSAMMFAANSSHTLQGVSMLLVYSLGLGIPFILSALLIDTLKSTFNFIKRNYKVINRISGTILIIIGVLMMTGYLNKVLALLTF
ncbi:cytochrome c biogenesis CcdA family protein [Clostridium sp.]|uniref:cytochrome c biogenesis CcdA family protein n=1 Tax=Clostridium sp. TaxID=1506 RepID=UPI0026DBD87F|nr:cytochrome c biogenesis protein CcdA [Clostridium sp.]MDO5040183.1 cytochrome c biogenesis protein CcdA [Clostridium sp.]